jgi:hypothetical protein
MQTIQRSSTSNIYCVPAALAALLDCHVDLAEALLKEELGDQPITGIYYPLIFKVLRHVDLDYRWIEVSQTYRQTHNETYLLCFNGHVGVVKDKCYFDNQQPNGKPMTEHPYSRKIRQIFRVWKTT